MLENERQGKDQSLGSPETSEFEEDIDRELEWNQRNLYEKWKGRMGFYYLLNSSKDY